MLHTELTIGAYFEERVAADPNDEFIVYPDRNLRWTYKQLNDRVDALARGLLASGIGKGDHVAILARNVPDYLTFFLATAKIGAVLVTVNTNYRGAELAYLLRQSDTKALVVGDRYRDIDYLRIVYELLPELRTQARGRLRSEEFPKLEKVIFLGSDKHRGMFTSSELIALGDRTSGEQLERVAALLTNDDVINLQYTSGTTGYPKGTMLTHRNILNNGYYVGQRQRFTSEDRLCLPVPLFHTFGIVLGVLSIMTHGGTLVVIEQFDPVMVLAAVDKEKCTALYGVPSMFLAELSHPMFDMFDYSTLRTGIIAGVHCTSEIVRRIMRDMHCTEITIAYGLTEASPVFTQTSPDDTLQQRIGTVGRGLPEIEIKVVNPETGETCGPNVQGELCCRGYNVMKGYYNMPEATAEVIDADGWLHSGDLGTVDDEGYYRITGRLKDIIIRRGENIYPEEIEDHLLTMEGIVGAQVVGVPDPELVEVVGAFVILDDDVDIEPEDIRDYCREHIARHKVPRHVFIVKDFPKTASGEIMKYRLRDLARELLDIKEETVDPEQHLPEGPTVLIHADQCKACGLCIEFCPKKVLIQGTAINILGYVVTEYKGDSCVGCGTCFYMCPEPGAITVIKKPKGNGQ